MMMVLAAAEQPANEIDRTPRVLIVEDDLGLTHLIERIFKRSGLPIELRFAHALRAARELMAESAFDLVVADFNLPDGKGLELLPADPETASYPVMLLTGQGDERVAVQAMKSGAVDYIVKTEESIRALPNTVTRLLREWGNELLRREMAEALHQNQLELREKHHQLQELYAIVEHSKKEWELTVDSLDDLIVRLDEHGNICRANRALCQLVDKPIEDLLGLPLADIFGVYQIGFQELRHGLNKFEIFHQASGRWFILNIYDLDDTEIGPGKVVTAHDYTALRELTMRLEESNAKLELKSSELEGAYEELKLTQAKALHQEKMATIGQLAAGVAHEINNPMGFIQSNLGTLRKYLTRLTDYLAFQDGLLDKDFHILHCNRAFLQLTGSGSQTLSGRHCWELLHHSTTPVHTCPFSLMLKSGRSESSIYQQDGRWWEIRVDPMLDDNGKLYGAIHVISDITTRKQAELERLELITQLEERNAELEQFTYSVSHDLKTPLVTINGLVGNFGKI